MLHVFLQCSLPDCLCSQQLSTCSYILITEQTFSLRILEGLGTRSIEEFLNMKLVVAEKISLVWVWAELYEQLQMFSLYKVLTNV